MVLTNALLSFGVSIVAGFTNAVHVPADAVPGSAEDLAGYVVGDPASPVNLYLNHRRGTSFAIENGAVWMFTTPDSYLRLQDPALIPRFFGTAILSSNQVLELAARTIERLAKTTNPIANIRPIVKAGRKFQGHEIPIYEITWPKPYYRPGFGYFAGVEIDARSGQITHLELHDPAFCDYTLAMEISRRVYIPEPPVGAAAKNSDQPKPFKRLFPYPTTNEVQRAIGSWLWLCARLGVNSGPETNLAAINWDRTFLFTNSFLTGSPLECVVEFKNGANFCAIRGIAVSHVAPDTFYFGNWPSRTREQMTPFKGRINNLWQDLARNLERRLVERVGIPEKCLASYTPHLPYAEAGGLGTESFSRVLSQWTSKRRSKEGFAFSAEFDVETGELKQIAFLDPLIIEALGRA